MGVYLIAIGNIHNRTLYRYCSTPGYSFRQLTDAPLRTLPVQFCVLLKARPRHGSPRWHRVLGFDYKWPRLDCSPKFEMLSEHLWVKPLMIILRGQRQPWINRPDANLIRRKDAWHLNSRATNSNFMKWTTNLSPKRSTQRASPRWTVGVVFTFNGGVELPPSSWWLILATYGKLSVHEPMVSPSIFGSKGSRYFND